MILDQISLIINIQICFLSRLRKSHFLMADFSQGRFPRKSAVKISNVTFKEDMVYL